MQRMPVCALAALAILSLAPHAVHAQAFSNGYIEWSLRPDAPRVPYDGAPFSEKYNHTAGGFSTPLLFGANPERLWYMYDMDRYDRAQRAGLGQELEGHGGGLAGRVGLGEHPHLVESHGLVSPRLR